MKTRKASTDNNRWLQLRLELLRAECVALRAECKAWREVDEHCQRINRGGPNVDHVYHKTRAEAVRQALVILMACTDAAGGVS